MNTVKSIRKQGAGRMRTFRYWWMKNDESRSSHYVQWPVTSSYLTVTVSYRTVEKCLVVWASCKESQDEHHMFRTIFAHNYFIKRQLSCAVIDTDCVTCAQLSFRPFFMTSRGQTSGVRCSVIKIFLWDRHQSLSKQLSAGLYLPVSAVFTNHAVEGDNEGIQNGKVLRYIVSPFHLHLVAVSWRLTTTLAGVHVVWRWRHRWSTWVITRSCMCREFSAHI